MLSGLYLITNEGIPLYFYNNMGSKDSDSNEILFSGIISAIQKVLVEVNVGKAQSFITDNYQVKLYPEDRVVYAFIIARKSKISETALNLLHLRLHEKVQPLLKSYKELNMVVNDISGALQLVISNVLLHWEKDQLESEASKKAKESLW
ncbi:MAG: hypothetical protein INQ03_09670 [Candidatus Heimdallarchaeota archaeon]|nr:hypothetical protein [Candidatus Heimdallarchaeota archaeon]